MRIILTGGGTGGHVIPNLAVIEELKKKKGVELLYIGSEKKSERYLVDKAGVDFKAIECGKLRRYFSWENFVDLFKVPVGFWQSLNIINKFKPDVIFSKGGYVSVPVVLAATFKKVPVILHESDVIPGLANRLCAPFVKKICLSFEESKKYIQRYAKKIVVTGNPIRKSLLNGNSIRGHKFTGLNKHRPVILVMGGSQGAKQINDLIHGSIKELLKQFQIVHIRGKGNLDISLKYPGYVQYEFIDEGLADVYAMCCMIISRGGANSLAEIAMLKKKALIIPLGTEASRGDQIENARIFAKKFGFGFIYGDISTDGFIQAVKLAYKNNTSKEEFENGVDKIVKLILKV